MAPNVVLVTGIADPLGRRLAASLAANPRIERVLGVDTIRPAGAELGRVEFVETDIRSPRIGRLLASARVDTVVHADVRAKAKEHNVIGTMQLLAGCQRAPDVRKLVVRSTAEVYGAGPTSPAVFTEQDMPDNRPAAGDGRDATEVESLARGFARRRPDVSLTIVRLAELSGRGVDTSLSRYLAMPVVPTVLGFDARVQLLHLDDAVAVLDRATTHDLPGVFNVGGDGVLLLSQAIRRAGRFPLPLPRAAIPAAARLRRVDVSPEQTRFLNYGRVLDTTRLKTTFGFTPKWSTADAFDDYVRGQA